MKIQTTTGLGFGSISTGITNLFNMFGDATLSEALTKFSTLNFNEFVTTVLLILAGIISIWYNEDKNE